MRRHPLVTVASASYATTDLAVIVAPSVVLRRSGELAGIDRGHGLDLVGRTTLDLERLAGILAMVAPARFLVQPLHHVLELGHCIASGSALEIRHDARVRESYLGVAQ